MCALDRLSSLSNLPVHVCTRQLTARISGSIGPGGGQRRLDMYLYKFTRRRWCRNFQQSWMPTGIYRQRRHRSDVRSVEAAFRRLTESILSSTGNVYVVSRSACEKICYRDGRPRYLCVFRAATASCHWPAGITVVKLVETAPSPIIVALLNVFLMVFIRKGESSLWWLVHYNLKRDEIVLSRFSPDSDIYTPL